MADGGVADVDARVNELLLPDCKPQLDSGKKFVLAEDLMPEKYNALFRKKSLGNL